MSKDKIVVLGLGMQGKAALYDIFQNCDAATISVADNFPELQKHLNQYPSSRVTGINIDATDKDQLLSLMKNASIVIDALPGAFAFNIAQIAAQAGVNLVSSMYYINPLEKESHKIERLKEELDQLDKQAKSKGVTLLPEFGLDPGIDLVMGAKGLSEFDTVDVFNSYGTGLPVGQSAKNPLKYRFSWSVTGVMHASKRPARIIRNGKEVEIDGLDIFASENRHILEIEELDTPMECYPNGNSIYYADFYGILNSIKEMGRYACRWPGHCDFWRAMVNSGFLNSEPVKIGSQTISPIEFTAALLNSQAQFHYGENDVDIAMVRTDMVGYKNGEKKQIIYQLIDQRDMTTGFTAMQRTVGFMMGMGARFILEGKISKSGVISPIDVPYEMVQDELKQYGMKISRKEISQS
ncbi:saccharopine dehydrogenase NADP-binding domain-containing protein [candidate division KSB1 bacterium]|nr:saccharopine dehydrogenase NADP-binding domain-containing protein [candidate division KSB1 bacterium]